MAIERGPMCYPDGNGGGGGSGFDDEHKVPKIGEPLVLFSGEQFSSEKAKGFICNSDGDVFKFVTLSAQILDGSTKTVILVGNFKQDHSMILQNGLEPARKLLGLSKDAVLNLTDASFFKITIDDQSEIPTLTIGGGSFTLRSALEERSGEERQAGRAESTTAIAQWVLASQGKGAKDTESVEVAEETGKIIILKKDPSRF